MKYNIDKHEKYTLIKLLEENMVSDNAPKLKTELIQLQATGVKNIVLDLSTVKYTDSSGLSALLMGNRLFKNSEGVFIIACLQSHVKKLIEISQLQSSLYIVPTIEEAIDMVFLEELEKDLLDSSSEDA